MKNRILLIFLLLPLFVIGQQDSSRHDTLILDKFFNFIGKTVGKTISNNIHAKNFHYGVSLTTGLFPNLERVHYQKESLYYGGGLNLGYNLNDKYSVNLETSLLNSRKYYEEIFSRSVSYNNFINVLYKNDFKFIMFIANLNFKCNLIQKRNYYYVKSGLEMTSMAYRNCETVFEDGDTTLFYSSSYTCKEQFTNIFNFTNKHFPDKPRFGLIISPGVNFTPLKKLNSFVELNIKFYPRRFFEMNFLRKFSFGFNVGVYI